MKRNVVATLRDAVNRMRPVTESALEERFGGRVALITGGASGIGRAVARRLVELGAEAIILTDVDAEQLERTSWALGGEAAGVYAMPLDVTRSRDWKTVVAEVVAEHGRIDDFFNNAGIGVAGLLRDTTVDDWQRLVDVNVMGVVRGVDAVYPVMREQGAGHIVNTASVAGLIPAVLMPAYSATKHAVFGFSMTLAAEAIHFGIDVSTVCPGIVNTPIIQNLDAKGFDTEEALEQNKVPLIPVEECAETMLVGMLRKDEIIVVGDMAKTAWRAFRVSPVAFSRANRKIVERMRRMIDR